MQYHIQTTPIWESYKDKCDCPLCALKRITERRLIRQYLGEAVMQPEYRVNVNKRGFCKKHFLDLFSGDNKLGVALQAQTRLDEVEKNIRDVKKPNQAKALAKDLAETIDTCVICDTVNETMTRYSYTIPEMYANEKEFPALFASSDGYCMEHFTDLLFYSSYAGKSAEEYIKTLIIVQKKSIDKAMSDLDGFARKFDYRNAGSVSDKYDDAIEKAIRKLKGDII